MLLLAVDTSGKNGSIALARAIAGQREIGVLEVVALAGGAFSAQLIPQIAALLAKHNSTRNDLEGFVVATGPGSFTGLRVGLAAIKALAEALQKPIVAISLLEAVAGRGTTPGRTLAVLDAGRDDVYVGDYEPDPPFGAPWRMYSERLLSREQFIGEAKLASRKAIVTPDAGLAEKIRAAGVQIALVGYPDSGTLARLGWEHLQRGNTVSPEELEVNYLRRSDAEIFSKPGR
jgi:tRNA threonylcarbamoyladenosine biosynthesis protein TsaB